MPRALDIHIKIDFIEAVEALSTRVHKDVSLENTDCISHSVGFVNEANQEFTEKMQELGLDISLGFIFDLQYFEQTKKVGFHASNYVVARCVQNPSDNEFVFADAYYGSTDFVKSSKITDLLTSSEDPDNLVIYHQENNGQTDDLVEKAEHPRPSPFRLHRVATRSIYLGETVGIEAIDQMTDSLDVGTPVDKSKIPVLLIN